ncbi:MAG TPA: glycosyltransferase [Pseudonocardiaceae bacterium]|jgi:glycosyltransferase involved in cell wall biosynthesis|nr:glycosyltransferase [Pseudonocardiaceae bacterium]
MVKFGFLSSYPPSTCGHASFTAALRAALPADAVGGVVAVADTAGSPRPPEVVGELVAGSVASCRNAATLLNREDVAIVAFSDGDGVPRVLEMLTVPAVVVLHDVPLSPTHGQHAVLHGIVATAAAVVVLSEAARARLVAGYGARANRVAVIPPGAPGSCGAKTTPHRNQQRQLLTWGLLGPGKGIEWAIDAMALLDDLRPEPRYVIAGRTHPAVHAHDGDRYRDSLLSRAQHLGVTDQIRFDSRYLDAASLRRLVAHAEVIVLPYDSQEQVASAVLVEAVASRTPVVATRFPHAVELLASGCGILVNHRDPVSIADAVRRILTDRTAAAGMAAAAGVAARDLGWPDIARRYHELAAGLVRTTVTLAR